jgi:hypothetical protein
VQVAVMLRLKRVLDEACRLLIETPIFYGFKRYPSCMLLA